MIDEYLLFVGIDWATEEHTICILDRDQKIVEERAIKHSGTGLAQLEELLVKLNPGEPARVAVAIEVPRGAGLGLRDPCRCHAPPWLRDRRRNRNRQPIVLIKASPTTTFRFNARKTLPANLDHLARLASGLKV